MFQKTKAVYILPVSNTEKNKGFVFLHRLEFFVNPARL